MQGRFPLMLALLFAGPVMAQDSGVQSTTVPGTAPPPVAPLAPTRILPGDISLNFPSADIKVVAKAVLGDILRVPYTIEDGVAEQVRVVTSRPIARQSVLAFFEEAIRENGLALVERGGSFSIEPLTTAKIGAPPATGPVGFANELVQLQFVGPEQLKRLLDPILPGVVASADSARNTLTLSGTAGQRASARDLIRQFDVNWLRSMSFGLYIPKQTDARLITPELDRLLNAADAPTRGLVRIIGMDNLNGILIVTSQPQYLNDVSRWIDILDREGRSTAPRLFVYRVQNGRSRDLSQTINAAFGNAVATQDGADPSGFAGNADGRPNTQRAGGDGFSAAVTSPAAAANNSPPSVRARARQLASGETGASAQGGGGGPSAIITSDDNNNAIIVFGTPAEFAVIENALRQLDVPPVQVFIEAAITEVSLNDDLRYGLQWNFTSGNTNTVLTDSSTGLDPIRAVPGFSFLFANNNLSAVLNTLETKTKVNVVSAPKLLVLNNQSAVLQVGDQVPVLTQSSTSTVAPNAPIINAIEYRDTGVILKVTPRVNATGNVLLDITQEVSDVTTSRAAGSAVGSPTISTRRISTSVAVADGEVLALGGLIRNTESRDRIGLPFLSQIPIIGALFGRQAKVQDRTELIVLLKPRVIRSIDDGRAITDELRRKIKTLEPFKSTGAIP